MSELSTKPYLLRAIYEWCTDSGYTPYIALRVDARSRVPMEFVRNGEIVLNISFGATSNLKMESDFISFSARFGGVSRQISAAVDSIIAIYAHENGQGMAFEPQETQVDQSVTLQSVADDKSPETKVDSDPETPDPIKKSGKPVLTRIK